MPRTMPIGLVQGRRELSDVLAREWGEARFRGLQVHRWVFGTGETDPFLMTSLPSRLRERLLEMAWSRSMSELRRQADADGTIKGLLQFQSRDAGAVRAEAVLIPSGDRLTVCVSSQAGCAVGCPFCATGRLGLSRDLDASEIAAQVLWARHVAGRWPTQVVFMGMGEPLANYEAVRRSIDLMRSEDGFGLGSRHLTISTAGVVPGILALAREPSLQVRLAVSLHAPDDALRSRLVPLNRRWPLAQLMEAVRTYIDETGRRVSMEYVLLSGVNDRPAHADRLLDLLRGMRCHVNLIPYNPVDGLPFRPAEPKAVRAFEWVLRRAGLPVTVRASRGGRIAAACGQLGAARPGASLCDPSLGG